MAFDKCDISLPQRRDALSNGPHRRDALITSSNTPETQGSPSGRPPGLLNFGRHKERKRLPSRSKIRPVSLPPGVDGGLFLLFFKQFRPGVRPHEDTIFTDTRTGDEATSGSGLAPQVPPFPALTGAERCMYMQVREYPRSVYVYMDVEISKLGWILEEDQDREGSKRGKERDCQKIFCPASTAHE